MAITPQLIEKVRMATITRIALETSIAHWKCNVAAATPGDATTSGKACALCVAFFERGRCTACPVREKTGRPSCDDTPYQDAYRALYRWENYTAAENRDAWRKAAQAELDFLISLRQQP